MSAPLLKSFADDLIGPDRDATATSSQLSQVILAEAPENNAILTEAKRLATLDRYDILDTPVEEAFDRITRLAQKIFKVPMAAVSLIDAHRQWNKSRSGFSITELPRSDTFCNTTIGQDEPLVIPDLRIDPRFATNHLVTGEAGLRFYAGTALRSPEGHNIGTICAFDTKPRQFSADEAEILADLASIAMDELELRLQATRDALTGALSRRAFKEGATRAVALALRHHEELTCIAFDLDRFKTVNDTYGHPAGDRVLVGTARACASALRESDLIGRVGGEEFAILLPKAGMQAAMEVAEKIRAAIAAVAFEFRGESVGVTASFGVASLDFATRDIDTLLAHADEALYLSKNGDRDRVTAWSAPEEERNTPQRRRVLKGGQIIFNNGSSVLDCTVRSISDEGAGVDVSTTKDIPSTFRLAIKADGFDREARVVMKTDRHLEVAFG